MAWRAARFKDKDVWAEVDAAGAPVVQGGRVAIRYSDRAGAKLYRAGASGVAIADGPARELPDGVAADAAPAPASSSARGSGFGKAGTRTQQQAALAAGAARQLIAALPADTARCYTDGACKGNPGPAGAGAVVELPDGRRGEASRALGRATNNVGELAAIGLALDLLDQAGVAADAPAAVFTDSAYVHGVLCLGWKAKANGALVVDLRARLAARPGVRLHWIAGHVGVPGNERADALANEGVAGRTHAQWS